MLVFTAVVALMMAMVIACAVRIKLQCAIQECLDCFIRISINTRAKGDPCLFKGHPGTHADTPTDRNINTGLL